MPYGKAFNLAESVVNFSSSVLCETSECVFFQEKKKTPISANSRVSGAHAADSLFAGVNHLNASSRYKFNWPPGRLMLAKSKRILKIGRKIPPSSRCLTRRTGSAAGEIEEKGTWQRGASPPRRRNSKRAAHSLARGNAASWDLLLPLVRATADKMADRTLLLQFRESSRIS